MQLTAGSGYLPSDRQGLESPALFQFRHGAANVCKS